MRDATVEDYRDSPEQRRELQDFLEQAWPSHCPTQTWEKRLAYWWDDNPWAQTISHRGWVARDAGRLVGYGGFIPAAYALGGKPLPALLGSSFHVDHDHGLAAVAMFRKQRTVQQLFPIVHSTPLPRIQQTLLRMGGVAETHVTRKVYLMGTLHYLYGGRWPRLDRQSEVITDPCEANGIIRPYRKEDQLEKWNSLEVLNWWCRSPMREHRFLGVVNGDRWLTSFLLLTPRELRGWLAWDVVEAFTVQPDNEELHALVGTLVRNPRLLPGHRRLLTAATFHGDSSWERTPSVWTRSESVGHYFLFPMPLRHVPKLTVMAEGDLGL